MGAAQDSADPQEGDRRFSSVFYKMGGGGGVNRYSNELWRRSYEARSEFSSMKDTQPRLEFFPRNFFEFF